MFGTVLIANRGEIAGRIARTLKRMGIAAAGIASDADRFSPVMRAMDRLVLLGPGAAAQTYLNIDAVVAAAREMGAEAVHPGYGFLSENIAFAERLAAEGIRFIGPRPEHIRAFGLKHTAREVARAAGVLLLPGSDVLKDLADAKAQAARIGYPVMLKSTAGGGGIGMHLCRDEAELAQRFESVARLAAGNFGDARLYLERFVADARHIEVQIFGDGKGKVLALSTRDCSLQRRNQKVIEEGPAPNLTDAMRKQLEQSAIALCASIAYESAGTVEFVYDADRQEAYFLEVNTRLQVEHPVTEEIFGIDLVEWMVRQAAGDFVLPAQESLRPRGHAMEARVYAENPARDFQPSTGTITSLSFPDDIRLESWIEAGSEISPLYDPMLAKIVVHGATREAARVKLEAALRASSIWGVETNLGYLAEIAAVPAFAQGTALTRTLKEFAFQPAAIEVLSPGAQSSLQDWPGRLHYWHVGIPPSGPMDSRSHRLVNRILGNPDDAAVLECTLSGPRLRFLSDSIIALGGADMAATLDGTSVPLWQQVAVKAGQTLSMGTIRGPGLRTYLAVAGGFDAPLYLGARATFSLGGFGGHSTGMLKAGDTLRLKSSKTGAGVSPLPAELPVLSSQWDIDVIYGPHGAPDFFTRGDIETLFTSDYEVHFNSARTGVRLIGPKPQWARPDGGEAGLHPSNLHDNAYAIGAIDFTGDMPIILGPDGPSLGGFVCPAVIAADELWKMGQLKPGDTVRFRLRGGPEVLRPVPESDRLRNGPEVLRPVPESDRLRNGPDGVVHRRQGDSNLLVEFGEPKLDLVSRLKAHLLMQALERAAPAGIIDLTPGIRSLQLHFDPVVLPQAKLLDLLDGLERELPDPHNVTVPSREVWLPLSWNDEQAELAMRKYQELVRPDAPWCPSNIEFIRRINGLASEAEVRSIIFDASYLVMGLGDVYLGAPVATPLDPRHRLVTTKYNPARTWTPENAVGIGGAYLCVYGMEGPGGYQLFGRTIQMWNRWKKTEVFERPWLLRFFDRIRFFPVSHAELAEARAAFPHGEYPLRIEKGEFSLAAQEKFLAGQAAGITAFKARQQAAFDTERQRWREQGLDTFVSEEKAAPPDDDVPPGQSPVHSATMGTVWKLESRPGEKVREGQVILVIETMKMETPIVAPASGILTEWRCQPGAVVKAGQVVALIAEDA